MEKTPSEDAGTYESTYLYLEGGATSHLPRDILPGWGVRRGRGLEAGAPKGRRHLYYSLETFYLDGAVEEGGDLRQARLVGGALSSNSLGASIFSPITWLRHHQVTDTELKKENR